MSHDVSRSRFLRGDFAGRRAPLRPPWALAEPQFAAACNACGECLRACPQGILVAAHGLPVVDFARGECTFCGACAAACQPGALSAEARAHGAAPWRLRALIGDACLARRGVVCHTCAEACAARAIRLAPQVGGAPLPEIDAGACTGCGACYAPCPVQAIRLVAP